MNEERVRVAVVGTGAWWGRQHAIAFSTRSDARLCAVVGRTPARTQERAAEFGVPGYLDVEEMLDRERPDLVAVCLPNEGHFEPTLRIIKAGFPLLVEKPLVFDLAEADRLLAEADRRGLFFAINFNHRYAKPVQLAHDAVRNGALGRLTFATWRFGGEAGTSSHPHANLIETQCHGLDMLEHLCGPISSVMAQMSDATDRGYSTLSVALEFENGAVGSLLGSYDSSYGYPDTHRLELNGLDGRVLVEDTVRRYTFTPAGQEISNVWQAGYFNDRERQFHATFDRHLDALLPAFVAGAEPPVHAAAGRRALQLGHCIIESYETGRRVGATSRG
jgi:myo-inositol 2-dehydrogenase / D-chiro-inositol 1-dehydrogenase